MSVRKFVRDNPFPTVLAAAGAVAVALAVVLALAPSSDDSSAGSLVQGDADCNQSVDTLDALADLRFAADAPPFGGCVQTAGNVNCDTAVDSDDVLALLLHAAGLQAPQSVSADCPAIGEPVQTPPPSTNTPTPTAAATPTVTGDATPTPSTTDGPVENGYHLDSVLSAQALGAAQDSKIELALIPGALDEAIIALQSGYMYHVSLSGSFPPELWGDIHTKVEFGNEQGLLSLAFSPDFEQDGRVYIYYTPGSPIPTVLSRFEATTDGLDEGSEEPLMSIEEFQPNHNGGHIVFDHDGYLLLSLGDGGGGGDPNENGQDLTTYLGKIIRIDVSPQTGYAIPQGNPFTDGTGPNKDEILAFGFRNPWRMTVDSLTGDIWLGDVGQNDWEEVDHVLIGGNYGWDCYEGFAEYEIDGQCEGKVFLPPRAVYDHDFGSAVTGGFVYRGSAMPELYGWYLYGDFYSGRIWAANTANNALPVQLTDEDVNIASFTELPNGELLIVSYSDGVYQLARD
ncbi:MAG: PQQ-dependent sugar dehydrogenase [Dehalococcoidia bacterium]